MYVCGWMDGWMDGCAYVCIRACMHVCTLYICVYVREQPPLLFINFFLIKDSQPVLSIYL